MKYIIIAIVIYLVYASSAYANDKLKHVAAGAAIGGVVSGLCERGAPDSDFFCTGLGTVAGTIAGAFHEAAQNDLTSDAGPDIVATSMGALLGSFLVIKLDF